MFSALGFLVLLDMKACKVSNKCLFKSNVELHPCFVSFRGLGWGFLLLCVLASEEIVK